MPVAKTYEHMEFQGEPFKENGRMYINVLAPKGLKKVRWYTEAEYKRMYPDAVVAVGFNARHAFGFGEKGYILIYKGKNVKEWAENDRTNIWYNLIFGYYTPSELDPPKVFDGIEAIKLTWDEVKYNDTQMKSDEIVSEYINNLIRMDICGSYQGEIDTWLEKEITITDKTTKESHFGKKHLYTMVDATNNTYIWETGARDYPIAMALKLKMKVKDHKEIDGVKTTIVWYCKEA